MSDRAITVPEPPAGATDAEGVTWARAVWLASTALLCVLGISAVIIIFQNALQSDIAAFDFHQFDTAAHAILRGENPYDPVNAPSAWGGPYPYPPLPALTAIPLTALPYEAAGVLVMAALVLAALATLFVLDVRDLRCYGLVLLWPPVISAVQTGNLSLWFALAAAVMWRYRARLVPASATLGLALAAKFFLWPLVVWLAATRRTASAVLASVTGASLLLVSWAVIGFDGFLEYPSILHKLENTVGEDSYTLYIVGLDAGLPGPLARAVWLGFGLGVLACVVALGRRGEDRAAFIVAIAASLALSPIVWLHYFSLLLVVVAVAQPRLGLVWFVPFGMAVTPGSGHPTPFETAWTLAVAAAVVALSVRSSLVARESAPASARVAPT